MAVVVTRGPTSPAPSSRQRRYEASNHDEHPQPHHDDAGRRDELPADPFPFGRATDRTAEAVLGASVEIEEHAERKE